MDWKRFGRELGMYIIASIVIGGTLWMLAKMFVSEIPAGNKEALMMVVGVFVTNFSMIVGYYYGSSKGSADKTDAMTPPDVKP